MYREHLLSNKMRLSFLFLLCQEHYDRQLLELLFLLLEMRFLFCSVNLNYLLLCVVPKVMFPWLCVCICTSGFHGVIFSPSVKFYETCSSMLSQYELQFILGAI
uniref:Uncharacterized protein n=1 Tax=Arundo donax TaxID=35708 RepID=A0A0A8ZSY8_ARUDO